MHAYPLRIGFVMLHTSPLDLPGTKDAGGMNVVVREHADALAAAGHSVLIYTRRSDTELADRVPLPSGVTVVHLTAGAPEVLPKSEHEAVMPEFAQQLTRELQQHPVDLLHAEHWFSGIAALDPARQAGIPLVQSYHSIAAPEHTPLTAGERAESPGRLGGERLLAHEADCIIAVSEAEQATILERLGADPTRVRVVTLGVDTELFYPSTPELRSEQREWCEHGGRQEVLVVGRLHPLKGFDLAIAAIATIAEERRPVLRIIGAPPPDGDAYMRSLHNAVAEAGMLATTAFEGGLRRGELAERLRSASLVLVPSHSETFGLVALEAAASGVPVVARNVGGLREAVAAGVSGVLVSGDSPEEWGREISRILDNQSIADALAAGAREHARTHSWAASAEHLVSVYREVLDRRRPGKN